MYRKSIFLFIFLTSFSIISNSEQSTEKIVDEMIKKDFEKIEEIEKQIIYDEDGVEKTGDTFRVKDGKNGNIIINEDISSSEVIVNSNANANSLIFENNANISSSKEIILGGKETFQKDKVIDEVHYRKLVYVINNKEITQKGEGSALDLNAPYVHYVNSENSVLKGSLGIGAEKLAFLDNYGMIETLSFVSQNTGSIINGKHGIIKNFKMAGAGDLSLKNEGTINNGLFVDVNTAVSRIVNSGTIKGELYIQNTDLDINDDRESIFLNTKTGVIKDASDHMMSVLNMNFQNFGTIETENDFQLYALRGKIDNNGKIKGNMIIEDPSSNIDDKKEEISPLRVNLQNGVLEGNLLLSRKGFKETIVTIKSMDNVTGELDSTEGDNDTLRLIGEGKITDSNKFKEFEKLHLDSSKWEFINEEYKVNNEILVENSNPSIRKAKLKTKKFTNNERSTINVLEASNIEVEDKFVNKGLISFLNSKDNTSNLSIKGNYIGENSKLLMRTYIDELKSDKLKLDGSVNGSTGVEISNPNSTLDKRMKNKLKLIETKSSTKDAFTLLNSEYGIYKYGLNLEGNDWYLNQTYNMPIIGIILNSTNNARNEFNLTFNDHNESIANKKLWTKLSKIYSNNILSGDNKFNLPIKSNTSNIFMGYDLVESNIKDRTYKYGVFGNVGFDKANNLGKTNAFGLGIYGTFKNNNWYVDSWLNYMYLKNRIAIKNELRYINHALKASLEIGTRGDMYIGKMRLHSSHYWQLIYSHIFNTGLKYDEDVKYFGNSNIKSRLGTNLTLFTHFKNINPYLEFNWIYDTRLVGVRVEKEEYLYNNNKNTFELKWGLREMNVNDRLSMWVNIVHRFNEAGYRANGAEFGVQYKLR
ncbi:autotransporter domain-containing protein [Streptobacillus moniliformis]|uniref:autotransporter family protein n=1 Tax=Streptobacillus moniliformis TaxID=34105 RepID=UPI0007E48810|nr:autotransporter domain-containing protein [Streptobacillus moniliformis]